LFEALHLAGVGLVIVAEEVEDAVKHEDAEFIWEGTTEFLGIAPGCGWGDGDVAEEGGLLSRFGETRWQRASGALSGV
jgi:hypothetical protein